jgi:ATP-dependent Zn protease
VDTALRKLILEAEACALEIIRSHHEQLLRLISMLEEHETLNREQIEKCLGEHQQLSVRASAETG